MTLWQVFIIQPGTLATIIRLYNYLRVRRVASIAIPASLTRQTPWRFLQCGVLDRTILGLSIASLGRQFHEDRRCPAAVTGKLQPFQ